MLCIVPVLTLVVALSIYISTTIWYVYNRQYFVFLNGQFPIIPYISTASCCDGVLFLFQCGYILVGVLLFYCCFLNYVDYRKIIKRRIKGAMEFNNFSRKFYYMRIVFDRVLLMINYAMILITFLAVFGIVLMAIFVQYHIQLHQSGAGIFFVVCWIYFSLDLLLYFSTRITRNLDNDARYRVLVFAGFKLFSLLFSMLCIVLFVILYLIARYGNACISVEQCNTIESVAAVFEVAGSLFVMLCVVGLGFDVVFNHKY